MTSVVQMIVPPMALGTSSVEGETVFADVDGGGPRSFAVFDRQ